MDLIKKLLQIIKENYQIAPIISGGTVLLFLRDVIFSKELIESKAQWGIVALLILFVSSALLYYFLSRLEKEKDVYLISSIGKLVEDVFRRYGQMMAKKNADQARAEDMNKIMQTIVSLVAKMKNLGNKKYRN
ncbi:MAG: hypothetical protein A3C22_03480 [Candidatus Levybacteria bacterium RIFCSPHIGHO2_02_FULL_37_10]|nr:MAG: hypothetical protein A3C22_03480 [Candidatus Levybacteria bacterium RIFCSPHIGHO2_02_FULL_37_10]OGH41620.1 MAG: hypothetical protein A3H79_03675 [Candidatus Levybacteria bacterium RIFCSPLOWO2_02_FULL_36_8b]